MLTLLLGCSNLGPWETGSDTDTAPPGRRIVVSPAAMDFGSISVNGEGFVESSFTVYNLGSTTEVITGHDEPIGSDAFSVDAPPLLTLEPGDERSLTVRYTPTTEQVDRAELLVSPSEETIRMSGDGRAPVLIASAEDIEPVVVGCSGAGTVRLWNDGSETLHIQEARIESEEFSLVAFPGELAPGQAEEAPVTFHPTGGGARGATLLLSTNDPLRPTLGVPLSALGYEGERVTESFRYTPSNPTDLLVLASGDGGMTAQLDKAADAIPAFVDALRGANIDYHLTALSGDDACPPSRPGWADRSDTTLQAETVLEQGIFAGAGPWDDDLLGLALEAVLRAERGDCLVGFRREEADLHVILLTDGPSGHDTAAAAAQLLSHVREPATFYLSALLPGGECGEAAPDYTAAVAAHNGAVEDICAADWAPALEALATLPVTDAAVVFPLAEVPVPTTIAVEVEGVAFGGWSWDASSNVIRFDGAEPPALGAEVTVTYVSSVACG
jgi:hypothetical protein